MLDRDNITADRIARELLYFRGYSERGVALMEKFEDHSWLEATYATKRILAIAMEARQGRNRETGSDPKDDSAGPQDIAR